MDAMSPSDAEVALRSLPRRYRAAVAGFASDDETGDLAHRAGPDGRSVVDHLTETTGSLSVLDRALEQVLTSDEPVLHVGVVDAKSRDFTDQVSSDPLALDEAILDLEVVSHGFADRVRGTRASEWNREGRVAGGGTAVRALDLVRRAVTESIDRLEAVERTVKAVLRDR